MISPRERGKDGGFAKMPNKTLKYLQIHKFDFINKRCNADLGLNHSGYKIEDFNRITCHNGVFIMSHFAPKLSVLDICTT